MKTPELEERTRRLIDNRGWGLWFRIVEWTFAVICLALIIFSLCKFKRYPDYNGWAWGPISVAFVSLLMDYTRLLGL
jgi:hypothetical protein